MPFNLDADVEANIRSRLKSEGFDSSQVETALHMARGLVCSVLVGFADFVKINPAEIDRMKLPGATSQQAEDFRKGAKHIAQQQGKIIEDTLQNLGIDRKKDVAGR